MSRSAVIFDLDGTLVDSAPGVITSLSYAFQENKIQPHSPLSPRLIGPPLYQTLRLLCPNADESELDRLSSCFRGHYDSFGFSETVPFPGVNQLLRALLDSNVVLHIATNKRKQPTSQILKALGWSDIFDQVLSPDSLVPGFPSKTAILSHLLPDKRLNANESLYIGDRLDDYKASMESGIPFALAEWGFEGDHPEFPPDIIRLQKPDIGALTAYLPIPDNNAF